MWRNTFHYSSNVRQFSKYIDKDRSGKAIRKKFLDYFINEKNHCFVRSSPVMPFCDPTVAFVNAGMNQFKGVFLGTQKPLHKKVANSQKCVRVGGKHNDLNVVGSDGNHHTFFEMLGSWSFGDYFKKEACELAWKLITEEYKINPSRLYVTYFKGDPNLGIEGDLETKDIWQSIGLPEDRILPFSSKDNFWEMGATGPCGPCTEIHVDHLTCANRAALVNKGLHDLTELWNLVFIQYNRKNNHSIELLPEKHVDTGMGFERLTALLQGKISNYETDNFTYLLKAIHKNCSNIPEYRNTFGEKDWNNLDTSYRILADHTRMITVCLADGIIPEQNQKLRRVLRRALFLSETVFKKEKGLLKELSNYIIENLGCVYPEMERNVKQIQQIIDYEEEVYKSIRRIATNEWKKLSDTSLPLHESDINENPNLVAGYKEILSTKAKIIDGKLAFKLYDAYGLDEEAIKTLARIFNIQFDSSVLHQQLELAKNRSKEQSTSSVNLIFKYLNDTKTPKTDRTSLYSYEKVGEKYNFGNLKVRVLKIFQNMEAVSKVEGGATCSLLLDKSNLYSEAGGQGSDKGTILFDGKLFEIAEVQNIGGYVLHKGAIQTNDCNLAVGDFGTLYVDSNIRLKHMRNHTAIHLLNSTLKSIKGATCQKSSKVTDGYLNLDVGIFDEKLSLEEINKLETSIQALVDIKVDVKISEIDGQTLTSLDEVTVVPGEIYPETGIRLVEIKTDGFSSREPCCGTHVYNTGDIKDFSLISVKSLGRGTASIHAVTGDRARTAKSNGIELLQNIETFSKDVEEKMDKPENLQKTVNKFKQAINSNIDDPYILPLTIRQECIKLLDKVSKQIKDSGRANLRQFIEKEMQNAIECNVSKTKSGKQYLVHYIDSSQVLESVPLQKATKFCLNMPVILITYKDDTVKARCCVPKDLGDKSFNAEKWLSETAAFVFQSTVVPPVGYDPTEVCNMRPRRVKVEELDPLLQETLNKARKYIDENWK